MSNLTFLILKNEKKIMLKDLSVRFQKCGNVVIKLFSCRIQVMVLEMLSNN